MTVPNTTLRTARISRRMSQDDLARAIRDAGRRIGEPNNCTKRIVQRWESGAVTAPRGPYLKALEYAMGEPAGNLGFADERYGLDRTQAMTQPPPRTEMKPETATGPLSGIWLSRYEYESSGRSGQVFAGQHYVRVFHTGNAISVQSLPRTAAGSLIMDLTQNGAVLTATWSERTNPGGYYQGSVYHGGIQLLADPSGRRMTGKWVGFGREWDVNVGPWSLRLVTHDTTPETIEQYNRPPEADTGLLLRQRARLGAAAVNHATVIRVLAERRMAALVDEGQAAKEIATREAHGRGDQGLVLSPDKTPPPMPPTLPDLGIDRRRLAEARQLARNYTEDVIRVSSCCSWRARASYLDAWSSPATCTSQAPSGAHSQSSHRSAACRYR